jgi:hypothetical protein
VPLIEAIKAFSTMLPPSRNSGSAFRTVNSKPRTFTLNCSSKCSSVICPSGANSPIPAFANRMSSAPCFSLLRLQTASRCRRASRHPPECPHLLANLAQCCVEFTLAPSRDEDMCAFINESPGCRKAEPAAAAGFDGYFTRQSAGHILFSGRVFRSHAPPDAAARTELHLISNDCRNIRSRRPD